MDTMDQCLAEFPNLTEQDYLTLRCVVLIQMENEVLRLKKLGINLAQDVSDEVRSDVFQSITNNINKFHIISEILDGKNSKYYSKILCLLKILLK